MIAAGHVFLAILATIVLGECLSDQSWGLAVVNFLLVVINILLYFRAKEQGA